MTIDKKHLDPLETTRIYGHEDLVGFAKYLDISLEKIQEIQAKNSNIIKKNLKERFKF
jgi:hypothetical protein